MWYVGPLTIVERNYGLVFSLFFFTILAVVIVATRVYVRVVMLSNGGLDDALVVFATVWHPRLHLRNREVSDTLLSSVRLHS